MISAFEPYKVLILKTDLLFASLLQQEVQSILPAATVRCETTIKNAMLSLADDPVDLLVTGVGLPDGDILELLSERAGKHRGFQRALIVTVRWEHRLIAALKGISIQGIFDSATEGLEQFAKAIHQVMSGGDYWSPGVAERLRDPSAHLCPITHLLSPTEQLVFATIGDGSDDKEAATRLSLRPSTIHSVRRELHRKLGVRHKGELMRMAVQHGYVRFTADGVQRPGFSGLLAACQKSDRVSVTLRAPL